MRKKLFAFPFPLIIVAIYVAIGVIFHTWSKTWVLFLLIPCYYEIINFITRDKSEFSTYQIMMSVPISSIVVLFYIVMGVAFGIWHPGWLVFFVIPIYYGIAGMFRPDKKNKDGENKS